MKSRKDAGAEKRKKQHCDIAPCHIEVPRIFWRYFDLYRRKEITIEDFSQKSGLSIQSLRRYLSFL